MGLERVAAVLQDKVSNFETDLFTPLIDRAGELTGRRVSEAAIERESRTADDDAATSLRIIADHARAATFLISDGVLPSNEGRGYVLRKILRRAIRHGRSLGQEKPFLFEMVYAVRDEMKGAYPISSIPPLASQEWSKRKRNSLTAVLRIGLSRLQRGNCRASLREDKAFHLYETFGLPLDFMVDAARDAGIAFRSGGI